MAAKNLTLRRDGCSANKDLRLPFWGKVCCKQLQMVSRQSLGVWVTEMMPWTKLILARFSI